MQTWGYAVVQSQGGSVTSQGTTITVAQMLNMMGQKGGELVTVVPAGSGLLEWIFKFPTQLPQGLS